MLILLPPSEGKTAPSSGNPLDLASLIAPERLGGTRQRLIRALEDLGTGEQAAEILGLGPKSAAGAEVNAHLRHSPCAPVARLYTGVLYDAARTAALSDEELTALGDRVLIVSALWGIVRLHDRIPDHRLSMTVALPHEGRVAALWKEVLPSLIEELATDCVVLDCRSGAYAPVWKASRHSACQQLTVKPVAVFPDGRRRSISHHAKHARGLLAGTAMRAHLNGTLAAQPTARDIAELAATLSEVGDVELTDHTLTLLLPQRASGR